MSEEIGTNVDGAQEQLYLTPEEQLRVYADEILASIIHADEESKRKKRYLFGQFDPNVFRDEDYILYHIMYKYKETDITLDREFYELILMHQPEIISQSKSYINIQDFAEEGIEPEISYIGAVLRHYDELMSQPSDDMERFKLTIEKYKQEFKLIETGRIYTKAKDILFDGEKQGRKLLHGYDDSVSYVKKSLSSIDSMLDKSAGEGFLDSRVVGISDQALKNKPEKIGDFGGINELNKHFGGIYTQLFYSIIAPTKGGKSKFCTYLAHIIATQYGNNVVVWAHEGGPGMWLAQYRARHFDYTYNQNEPDITKRMYGVSQDTIFKNSFESDKLRNCEEASRTELFTNPDYGYIELIDRPFKLETFIDEIDTAVKLSNAKAIIIDYLQLITSDTNKSKNEVIGTAYQKLLAYIKSHNIAAIVPGQFTQDFMNMVATKGSEGNFELRTSGGESSEVIRTPDVNIALYASAEDLMHKQMKLMSIPSRTSSPFPAFDIYADLGGVNFASLT